MLKDFAIIKVIFTFILPYILLYALYIQFNGELLPGGGFQAGAIFAAAIIAYDLSFGASKNNKKFSTYMLVNCGASGVLIYGCTGLFALWQNKNFLDYSSLSQDPLVAQHLGIMLIEIGVGITVSAVLCLVYFSLRAETNRHNNE